MTKYLYLPLEIAIREQDGKTLLAAKAALQGWTCIVGPKREIYRQVATLPPGGFVLKSASPSELHQLQMLRESGHKICSLDEEEFITYREYLKKDIRYSEKTVDAIDRVFFWGDIQHDYLTRDIPAVDQKCLISGSPRFDFWHDYAASVYEDEVQNLRRSYGKFVFIPSSFGFVNNAMGPGGGLAMSRSVSSVTPNKALSLLDQQAAQNMIGFREYLDFLPELARQRPNCQFVFRPHPSEDETVWRDIEKRVENFHVCYEGAVTSWLLAAQAVMHYCSTSAVEAYAMGRNPICYFPPIPDDLAHTVLELPMHASVVVDNRQDVFAALDRQLQDENVAKDVVPDVADLQDKLNPWIHISDADDACARMLEDMDRIVPAATQDRIRLRFSVKERIKILREEIYVLLAKWGFAKFARGKFLARIMSESYGARKYVGIDLAHTKNLVSVVAQEAGKELAVEDIGRRLYQISPGASKS